MLSTRLLLPVILVFAFVEKSFSQKDNFIRISQAGYHHAASKIATINTSETRNFEVLAKSNGQVVFNGKSSPPRFWSLSNEMLATIDFSSVTKPGEYSIQVQGLGESYHFKIKENAYRDLLIQAAKSFYFFRSGTAIPKEFGGIYAREEGHLDQDIHIHPSAYFGNRNKSTRVNGSKGWYDAGDYNKYIVNSSITVYTLLHAFQNYENSMVDLTHNVPESKNNVPDILDEIRWNLDWMLTMQDPQDGGIYHKLTSANFDKMVMPKDAQNKNRYMVKKSSAATYDFIAVMALAYRVYQKYDIKFAEKCLAQAKAAMAWHKKNSEIYYDQELLNKQFKPSIKTGEYGDKQLNDEKLWAETELAISTNNNDYFKTLSLKAFNFKTPDWRNVELLPVYSLYYKASKQRSEQRSNQIFDTIQLRKIVLDLAIKLKNYSNRENPHRTSMGQGNKDFSWGSNGQACNQTMVLLIAYKMTNDKTFLEAAERNFEYLYGRNATGYSFVTGVGNKQVMKPHHRLSSADGIEKPIPGMLSGGPQNTHKQPTCHPKENGFPASTFYDIECSFSTNEIAINWNAPFVFTLAGLYHHSQK